MITIGLDPHPSTHTIAAMDEQGFVLGSLTVKNSDQGFGELLSFAGQFSEHRWAIEGAGNRYILPFVQRLLRIGDVVHHIPPNLTSQYRSRASHKKNDVIDVQNAAKVLLVNPELPEFHHDIHQRKFQDLTRVQRKLSEQLKANRAALEALDTDSCCRVAFDAVIAVLEEQLCSLERQLRVLVKANAPSLLILLT